MVDYGYKALKHALWGPVIAATAGAVAATHMMEEADELSDRVCIVDHGRIMAVDTPAALKE